jgi:hypothetical protein
VVSRPHLRRSLRNSFKHGVKNFRIGAAHTFPIRITLRRAVIDSGAVTSDTTCSTSTSPAPSAPTQYIERSYVVQLLQ